MIEVKVRGQEGIWVEASSQGSHQTEEGEMALVPWNILLWTKGDFLFWIYSNGLSREETLQLAESLQP
jgi:hypothetical protein